ncbi:hypothetical protein QFC21_006080 [Naganishia friedmannii]|uniref:Uncharacterized protein n=1 Tax=Naganishia friedmannii TaxID=89922 RepID=A0ACC2V4I2_9TREE|nr:hypothetical protein QFC21_006080 [Naganishia friedmannii]
MFSTAFVTIALLLASGAEAIKVTSPSETTVQKAGSALQLTWDSVSTDPTSFAVVLVNQNSAYLANSPVTLIANQTTSAGSTSLSYPSGSWPAGTGFQVNLVKSTNDVNSILAQSGMFNITASASSASSSAASSSVASSLVASSSMVSSSNSASTSGAATIVQSATSAVYTGNAQTSATAVIPSAASKSSASSSGFNGVGSVIAVVGGLMAVGAVLL